MTDKPTIKLNIRLFAAMLAAVLVASLATAIYIPNGTELPIHWNISFEPDRFANKWLALFMLPTVSLLIAGLFKVIPLLEPRSDNLQKSASALKGIFWAVEILFVMLQASLISFALKYSWPMEKFLALGLGLTILVIGNYLGKTRSTFVLGIRTPWTLSSDEVWKKTHRLSGIMLFILGLITMLITPWATGQLIVASIITLLVIFGWATVYSFILWRKEAH